MKKLFLAALAALFILPAAAQEQPEVYPSYIQVNGRAEKEVTPDEFYLQIVINERDSKGKISVESQQRDMIAALKKLGISTDRQLTVSNVSSTFFKKNTALASAKYQLKLTSAAQLSAAWQALSDLGISDVSLVKVGRSDLESLKQEVRKAAIVDARTCAEELAGLQQRRDAGLLQQLDGLPRQRRHGGRRGRRVGRRGAAGLQDRQADLQRSGEIRAEVADSRPRASRDRR